MAKKDNVPEEVEETLIEQPKESPMAEAVDLGEGLVKMRKGNETLDVHPTTVKAHLSAGWTHA